MPPRAEQGEPTEQESPIHCAIRDLEKKTSILWEEIGLMEEALAPILMEPDSEPDGPDDESGVSALHIVIIALGRRVGASVRKLASLRGRVTV